MSVTITIDRKNPHFGVIAHIINNNKHAFEVDDSSCLVKITLKQQFNNCDILGSFDFSTHQSQNLSKEQIEFVINHGTVCDHCKTKNSRRAKVVVVNNNGNIEVWGKNCFEQAQNQSLYREIVQILNDDRDLSYEINEGNPPSIVNSNSGEFELDVVWSMICNSRKQIANTLNVDYANYIDRGLDKNCQLDCDDFLKFVEDWESIDVGIRFVVLYALQTKVVRTKVLNQVASILNQYYIHKKVSTSKTKEFIDGEKIEFDGELVSAKVTVSFGVYERFQTQIIMIDDDNNRYVWYKSGWIEFKNKDSNRIHFKGKSKSITNVRKLPTLTLTRGKITE